MQSRKNLLRWNVRFFAGNMLLFWLIGLLFVPLVPWVTTIYLTLQGKIVTIFFTLMTLLGHFGLLAILPGILLALLILLYPQRLFIMTLAVLCATGFAWMLVVDAVVYRLYHFHLNGLILNMLLHWDKEVFSLSSRELLFAVFFLLGIFITEIIFARWLWRCIDCAVQFPKRFFITMIASLCVSYSFLAASVDEKLGRYLLDVTRIFPYYTETLALISFDPDSRFDLNRVALFNTVQPYSSNRPLRYPIAPLHCAAEEKPMNLVVIVIDAWRFDMLNKSVTPDIADFAKKSITFTTHFSGGNSTGPGIFSLFYGVPATYLSAMQKQQRGPLLFQELIKQHYQLSAISSAGLEYPPFDQNVFRDFPNLDSNEQKGSDPLERDKVVTVKFKKFIEQAVHRKEPFFSFLFYDAAHGYCAVQDTLTPFQPIVRVCNRTQLPGITIKPELYLNRYKNALYRVNNEVKEVLDTLKNKHLLDNTIVVITGDHGEEIMDSKQALFGHASNFTRYQVQTPLIVYWPGQKPRVISYETTHFDVVPTLMKQMLGCKAAFSDYSMGKSLFDSTPRPYLIIGSYVNFGVRDAKHILSIYPSGMFKLENLDGEPSTDNIVFSDIGPAFQDMRRFFH